MQLIGALLNKAAIIRQWRFCSQEQAIKVTAISQYKKFTAIIGHFRLYVLASIKKVVVGSKVSHLISS